MLRDTLDIKTVLTGMEQTLCVNYSKERIEDIVRNSIQQLENAYRVELKSGLYEAQMKNRLISDSISQLVVDLTEQLKTLSLIISVSMFDRNYGETLRDVNYLGYSKNELMAALKYLQCKQLYDQRVSFFNSIVARIDSVPMCTVKRLWVVLIILERLNMADGVSILAQYLYIGGLS